MWQFSHRLAFRPCGSKPGFQVIAFRVQSLHGSGAAAKAIDLHLAFNVERERETAGTCLLYTWTFRTYRELVLDLFTLHILDIYKWRFGFGQVRSGTI